MHFDGCLPPSQASTAALPAIRQFLGQSNTAAVFEHNATEPMQQFQGHRLLGMDQDADHFFQDGMQKPGTGLSKAFMHCRIAHIHFPNGSCGGQRFQARIWMGQPAKHEHLQQICSAKGSLTLDTASLSG
jgi:hypothetical protein